LRIENSIKALSRVCELDIIHCASVLTDEVLQTDQYFSQYANHYLTLYDYSRSRIIRFFQKCLYRLFGYRSNKNFQRIVKYIKQNKIKIVWFGYGNISYALICAIKAEIPTVKVVCDTDSVWSRFILRELPFAEGRRKRKIHAAGIKKEREEKAWTNLCEVTTAVSEVDAEYYRSISGDTRRVHLFSNVIDLERYKIVPLRSADFIKPCIFLAGSFGPNSAMNMAAEWVLSEVLPILLQTFPDLNFYIVGSGSDQEFGNRASRNITVTGKVDSVLPFLCHADVALVPLKFESGTRFKILEAAACYIPIVSTKLGAEGLQVNNDEHLLIADDAHGFADAIKKILSNREFASSLAANCYKLVSTNYTVDSLVIEAQKILDFLTND